MRQFDSLVALPAILVGRTPSGQPPLPRRRRTRARLPRGGPWKAILAATLILVVTGSCAVNPATGERQIILVSERQEIEMGRDVSRQVERQMGLYDDPDLQAYVSGVGMAMARRSERPDLPWEFRVVEEPVVNAFAVPGGFIYLTRGILAHFNSEAEMAAVVGHEIGHVTARHSVRHISRAQLAQLGLGLGAIFVEPLGGALGDVAAAGVGILFLQYSRDDEREADRLGIRYMLRQDHDPREAIHVFEMLQRQAEAAGASGTPGWLSTHPAPEDRIERIQAIIDTLDRTRLESTRVERESFLERLDGLVYGQNPRHGFFRENLFLHPDLRFRLTFPRGWETRNMARAVMAGSPREDAILQLTLAETEGHRAAATAFFDRQGIEAGRVTRETINGHPATTGRFRARTDQGVLEGIATFLDYGGRTYQILGYTVEGRLGAHERAFLSAMGSFDELTDRSALDVQPMRLQVIRLDRSTSIRELARTRDAPVSAERLALLNGVGEEESLPAGQMIKWVVGDPPPGR